MYNFELLAKSIEPSGFEVSTEEVSFSEMSKEKVDKIVKAVVDDLIDLEEQLTGYYQNIPESITEEELNREHQSY